MDTLVTGTCAQAERCDAVTEQSSILHRSEMAILEHLGRGSSCFEQVARTIGLSQRTLQRRLSGCGCGFAELVDGVRRNRAELLLRQESMPLVEIALALGYSDQTAFSRAFKRWMNCTPGAYRRLVRSSWHQSDCSDACDSGGAR